MAINLNLTQGAFFGAVTPPPGLGSWDFYSSPGSPTPPPIFVTVTGFVGDPAALVGEVLWKPYSDTTATLTQDPANLDTFTIAPACDWEGGSYRIRVTDSSGESVTRTFGVQPHNNIGVPLSSFGLSAGLPPTPSPMEVADGTTVLDNITPERIRESETNAQLPAEDFSVGFGGGGLTPTPDGSPWGWWSYIRQINRSLYVPDNPRNAFLPSGGVGCRILPYTGAAADAPDINDNGRSVYWDHTLGTCNMNNKPGFNLPPAGSEHIAWMGVYCGEVTPAYFDPAVDGRLIAVRVSGWSNILYTEVEPLVAPGVAIAPDPSQPSGVITVPWGTPGVGKIMVGPPSLSDIFPDLPDPIYVDNLTEEQGVGFLGAVVG